MIVAPGALVFEQTGSVRRDKEVSVSYLNAGQPGYTTGYQGGSYVPKGRNGFRTFIFAALIALIPFVGAGASAIYVERRKDPSSFNLGAACGASFLSFLSILGFIVTLGVIFAVVGVFLSGS